MEAVRPFFEQFIKALPKVEDVAVCPEEAVAEALGEDLGIITGYGISRRQLFAL